MKTIQVVNPLKYVYEGRSYDSITRLKSSESNKISNLLIDRIDTAFDKHRETMRFGIISHSFEQLQFIKTYLKDNPGIVLATLKEMDKLQEDLDNAVRMIQYNEKG